MKALLLLLIVLFLLSLFCSSASSITLSLSPVIESSTTNKWQDLKRLVAESSFRVRHLKQSNTDVKVLPLFPRVYGQHSPSLSFGTPPQNMTFIMDTGHSFSWMPCTKQYKCKGCDFPGAQPKDLKTFEPKSSSTSAKVSCDDKKFMWMFPDYPPPKVHESGCFISYEYLYGLGLGLGSISNANTTGNCLFESLTFPGTRQRYDDYIIGCSTTTYGIKAGIAGLGRTRDSLPSQMGLDSFSYCLVPHKYDKNPAVSSNLVLTKGWKPNVSGINYTPFLKNPNISSNPGLLEPYYVSLQNITVGGVNVKGLKRALSPDKAGNGGTIMDSRTTATYLPRSWFNPLTKEIMGQVAGKYNPNTMAEKETGLGLCLDVPRGKSSLQYIPKLEFHFKRNTVMNPPLENYFLVNGSVGCLLMFTGIPAAFEEDGAAIVLGNYLQQNYYMEYDLKNNRLGILPTQCKK